MDNQMNYSMWETLLKLTHKSAFDLYKIYDQNQSFNDFLKDNFKPMLLTMFKQKYQSDEIIEEIYSCFENNLIEYDANTEKYLQDGSIKKFCNDMINIGKKINGMDYEISSNTVIEYENLINKYNDFNQANSEYETLFKLENDKLFQDLDPDTDNGFLSENNIDLEIHEIKPLDLLNIENYKKYFYEQISVPVTINNYDTDNPNIPVIPDILDIPDILQGINASKSNFGSMWQNPYNHCVTEDAKYTLLKQVINKDLSHYNSFKVCDYYENTKELVYKFNREKYHMISHLKLSAVTGNFNKWEICFTVNSKVISRITDEMYDMFNDTVDNKVIDVSKMIFRTDIPFPVLQDDELYELRIKLNESITFSVQFFGYLLTTEEYYRFHDISFEHFQLLTYTEKQFEWSEYNLEVPIDINAPICELGVLFDKTEKVNKTVNLKHIPLVAKDFISNKYWNTCNNLLTPNAWIYPWNWNLSLSKDNDNDKYNCKLFIRYANGICINTGDNKLIFEMDTEITDDDELSDYNNNNQLSVCI